MCFIMENMNRPYIARQNVELDIYIYVQRKQRFEQL